MTFDRLTHGFAFFLLIFCFYLLALFQKSLDFTTYYLPILPFYFIFEYISLIFKQLKLPDTIVLLS